MDAFLSGQVGVVVLLNGKGASLKAVGDQEYRTVSSDAIPHIFRDASDVLHLKNTSAATAFRTLENEWNKDSCLHLMLIVLRSQSHLQAISHAIAALDMLLNNEPSLRFVMNRLYSSPLPDSADIDNSIRRAEEKGASVLGIYLRKLRGDQTQIAQVRDAWERLPIELFKTLTSKRDLEGLAVEDGLFYGLVNADHLFAARSQWFENGEVIAHGQCRAILDAWSAALNVNPKIPVANEGAQLGLFDERKQF